MNLHEMMVKHGNTFFRWRGYIPLLFIGPILLAFQESVWLESLFGDTMEDIWVFLCFILSLSGLALRAATVGFIPGSTSGRNTKAQRADVLNTSGLYSIVRNPLYLANFIIILGLLLSLKVWWLVLLLSLTFLVYMERIILAEESYLREKFGQAYADWCAVTPAILPRFNLWRTPDMRFSWKTVLKREYPGFLAIGTAFFVTEIITDIVFEGEAFSEWVIDDLIWPVTYIVMLVIGLTLRYMKKHTNLLKVAGR
ncbi:MAG TPA: methyltransferase [Alphaproteobacteria bacterium]